MTDVDYDLDDDALDSDGPDDSDLVKRLRKELRRAKRETKDLAELREENQTLKRAQALRDAKVEGLTDRQMKVLAREHEGDITPEAIRQTAIELGFVSDETDADLAEHEQIDNASAGSRTPPQGQITPDTVKEWSTEKIVRFREQYPDAFEQIKRGNPVSGITF